MSSIFAKQHLEKIIAYGLILILSIICFLYFQIYYKFHLLHRLDVQLFLYSKEYILGYFDKPAWLAAIIGDFLTQFFYFNIVGALILAVVIAAVGCFVFRSFEIIFSNDFKGRVSFVISLLISLLAVVWECFRNFAVDYKLSSTLALAGGMLFGFLYLKVADKYKIYLAIAFIPLSYWLFGYGFFATLFLILIFAITRRQYLLLALFSLYAFSIPLFLRQVYELTYSQAYQYPSICFWGNPDQNIEELLKYDSYAAANQWQKIAEKTEESKSKSGLVTYYYNLSHGLRGDLPDKLLMRPQSGANGMLIPLNPNISHLAIWASSEVWFQLGDMTMAEHSAMLAMIFSQDHRSSRMVKRLAEINMINNDTVATIKYLNILSKTWLYKNWAQDRMPGRESAPVKAWIERRREYIAKSDTVRNTSDPRVSLRALLDANNENKLAIDYLLCFDLLAKDTKAFVADYDKYKLPLKNIPEEIYAQALLVAHTQLRTSSEAMSKYRISSKMYTDFFNYTAMYKKRLLGDKYFVDQFGKTYWFYYHYAIVK